MKNYLDKFFILFATIIIGVLITTNFDFGGSSRIFQMNSKAYKDASEEKNNLYKEVDRLREENREIQNKIYSYHHGNTNDGKIIQDMKNQLIDYNQLNGTTNIKGPGVVLRVTDGDFNSLENTSFENNRRILHDIDAALILNELRAAGAQAIGVNDFRVLGNTGVECDWAFIGFNDNDQSQVYLPFYFYAIGDPDELETSLLAEGSHINRLIIRKLNIEIKKVDEIILYSTENDLEVNFMKRKD